MAVFTAIASAITAISGWTITIGTLGSFAVGNFLLRAAVQLGVSALAKAFAGEPAAPAFSIQGQVRTGGAVPRSFGVGPYLTAGSLVWHTEWGKVGGTPNAYYTQVIALSDLPVSGLRRWFIENQAVTLAETESEFGFAANEFIEDGVEYAWIRFHDGTQKEADPFLTLKVSDTAPRSYSASRIGAGIAYAVVTFRVNREIFTGFPRSKFVLDGIPLYDVSRDSSQGGVGSHRWDDPTTWGGDGDALPAVQAYNLSRGIYYARDFGAGGAGENASLSLDGDLASLSLKIVGGGGGTGSGGAPGAATVVTLKDGASVVQTWTAAGGAAGIASDTPAAGGSDRLSALSPRGDGGIGIDHVFEGGGEGAGILEQGYTDGSAGQYLEVLDYDISALSDPVLEISIGAGGAGSSADGSADGRDGYVAHSSNVAAGAIVPQWFYGLQGLTAARLPAAHWISQIEKCRSEIDGDDGPEPLYRSAGEIPVDAEIGKAFEAILTACAGRMSEIGGVFKIYVGGPDAPIAHIDDGDIVSTAPQSFTPFFGLSETVNGVVATYPSPDEAYVMRSTPPVFNEGYEVEDGGRRLLAKVELSFVPFPAQAQRLLNGELAAARRARRHTFTLPAKYRLIEPGDVVTWTSPRNGYEAKQFRVDGVVDLPNCDLVVDITEVDPSDHGGWDHATDFTPVVPVALDPVRPAAQAVVGFNPVAWDVQDAAGTARRPGLLMQWDASVDDVAGVVFEVRVKATSAVIATPETRDFAAGNLLIQAGLVQATEYEVRAKYIPASPRRVSWTPRVSVSTNDVRLVADDFAPESIEWSALAVEVKNEIDSAGNASASAAAAEVARIAAEQAEGGAVEAQGIAVDASTAAVGATVAALPARLTAPVEAWTDSNHLTGAFPRPAISGLRLITGDADFGDCYESTTANATVGPAQALPFDRSRAYLVRVRVKTIDDGASGGARVMIGFSTFNAGGAAVQQSNVQVDVARPLPAADGVQEYAALIYPSTVGDLGTFSAHTHGMQHSAASDASDLIAFHLRHNAGNETNGKVRVGLIEVKDVTDVLNANISAKASYDAEQAAYAYRDEAGTHAGAANTAKIAAEAAQGQASGFASSASQSASNAATSASTANSAKASAISARDLSVSASNDALLETITALPSTFEQDGRYFTSETAGAPGVHPLSGWSFKSISGEGRVAYRAASAGLQYLYPSGVIRPVVGRTYRLTVTARRFGSVTGSPHISMFFRELNANYGYVSLLGVNSTNLSDSMASYVLEFSPTTEIAYVRAGFYTRNEATGTGEIRIQSVKLEDVTATAEAEAYKVSAGVSETAAVAAAGEAQDAAAAASFARDVASRVMTGGGNPNPIFIQPAASPTALPDDYNWSDGSGSSISRKASGGKYGACIEYTTGSTLSGSKPYIAQNSNYTNVQGLKATNVEAVEIDFEVEMISGTWGEACIWVRWEGGTGGVDKLVSFYLRDLITSQNGKVQRVQGLAIRPDGFVPGSQNDLLILFYGNIAANSNKTNHTARIHRFDYHVVSKSASSLIQQKAVNDLQGNAEASLVFRAKAGGAAGAVEIVAAENAAGGAASKVSLTGDEIEFDGMSVFKDVLKSNVFSAGSTGWRITKDGKAEFNDLLVRSDLKVNSISDGVDDYISGGDQYVNATVATLTLGQSVTPDTVFSCGFHCEYRGMGLYYYNDAEGFPQNGQTHTTLYLDVREKTNGSWGGWSRLFTSGSRTSTAWGQISGAYSRMFNADDVQLRLYASMNAIGDSPNNNVRRIGLVLRSIPRR